MILHRKKIHIHPKICIHKNFFLIDYPLETRQDLSFTSCTKIASFNEGRHASFP